MGFIVVTAQRITSKVCAKATYVDLKKNWRRLGPIFRGEAAKKIWLPCIEEHMEQRAEGFGFKHKPLTNVECPAVYDSCDWRYSHQGRRPAFWDYAKHSACHWVADLGLFVAMLAFPREQWRIVTSQEHTTVWNGSTQTPILFDINFSALGIAPRDALKLASRKGRQLKPGRFLKRYLHQKITKAIHGGAPLSRHA